MKSKKETLIETQPKISVTNGPAKQNEEAEGNGFLQHTKELEIDDPDMKDTKCGIGQWEPKWMQRFATKEVYMVFYSIIGLTQGMFFTYTVSVISTIEKRFKLSSKQTGTMLSGNDISQVIFSIILAYYGNYGHRPRWMAIGVLCSALSCFLAAIPHFIYGPGLEAIRVMQTTTSSVNGSSLFEGKQKEELCRTEDDIADPCSDSDGGGESYVGPVVLLFISQFMVGITVSLFYTLGVTYLDDNINKKKTPMYYAVSLMIRILGPVFGFFLGSKCLSMWIEPQHEPNLTTSDPRWFGAWWFGFLFLGVALTMFGVVLFLFPRILPESIVRQRKRAEKQAAKDAEAGGNKGVDFFANLAKAKRAETKPTLKNLRIAMKRLFTNRIWMGSLFNAVVFLLAVAGYYNFKPKYLESQFRKSASDSNFYTGLASFVASLLGTALSGAIMRWARPGPRFVTGYNIFLTLFASATFVTLMFIGCPKLDVIGPMEGSTVPDCSSDCECSDKFAPVCAEDNTTLYYSACYAGCSSVNSSMSPVEYSDCQCVRTPSNISMAAGLLSSSVLSSNNEDGTANSYSSSYGSAVRGYCPEPCDAFKYYIIIQIVTKTIAATGRVGNSIVLLRSVSDEDKGLALGTMTVFISLFGFIPAPIIMGAIVDSACIVWDKNCGVQGNCWLYDSEKFRIILHLVPAILVLVSVLGDIVVYYYSRQLDLYGEREDEVEMEKAKGETDESKPLDQHTIDPELHHSMPEL
ncbi:solute carrier organic anion transporter family member 74D-like [Palaemon carinicauda]|uniref:solute carrier organic anion transporter family member 74D-like n=1 Tax=Palaemon carinicauda TaxID=392227 RepID=UPI0035B609A4